MILGSPVGTPFNTLTNLEPVVWHGTTAVRQDSHQIQRHRKIYKYVENFPVHIVQSPCVCLSE